MLYPHNQFLKSRIEVPDHPRSRVFHAIGLIPPGVGSTGARIGSGWLVLTTGSKEDIFTNRQPGGWHVSRKKGREGEIVRKQAHKNAKQEWFALLCLELYLLS